MGTFLTRLPSGLVAVKARKYDGLGSVIHIFQLRDGSPRISSDVLASASGDIDIEVRVCVDGERLYDGAWIILERVTRCAVIDGDRVEIEVV